MGKKSGKKATAESAAKDLDTISDPVPKKGKKGRKGGDSSDDEESLAKDSPNADNDEGVVVPVSNSKLKKSKKKSKKVSKETQHESDEDPLAIMNKLAALELDEDENDSDDLNDRTEEAVIDLKKGKKKKSNAKMKTKNEKNIEDNDVKEDDDPIDDSITDPNDDNDVDVDPTLLTTLYGDDVFSEWGMKKSLRDETGLNNDNNNGKSKQVDEYDGDGKKLSRKELKKLANEKERAMRELEYNQAMLKASAEGKQFAVSQTIVDLNDPQWLNALDIVIPSISISAHNKELYVNTELIIAQGRRYGLVGANGAGKSTLLKMISSGELKIPPRIDQLYVEQEVVADDTCAVDSVLKADKIRWNLIEEEKQLLKDLENGPNEKKDTRLGEIYEELANIGASSAESKARKILFGLGFNAEMQSRATKYFSGGWRMRIALARALFIEPTLLMLDEPTNHLDLNAVIWLDDYLQKWKKTLLIVSHDQDFLNSVCEEILHVDDKAIITYKGNYDNFKEQEEIKRRQQLKAWEKQEKKLKELKRSGVSKANAEKEQLKNKSREPGARSKKKNDKHAGTGQEESGESQMELLKRPKEYSVQFGFPEVSQVSPPILEVRDVSFQYGPKLPLLFRQLNFGLDMDSRICIVGPNGSGKSTLLKLITDDIVPTEGEVLRNPRLRIGIYNQHFVDRLPMEEDPVTYLRRLYQDESYQSIRNILGRYGLEGHAHTIPMRDLSGGQKARVVLVELSLMAPHLLFLDEPTNNLDIESIDALCIALREYNGGVILVSHDARLIEEVECQLWVVDEFNVWPWENGFDGYRKYLLQQLEEQLTTLSQDTQGKSLK